MATLKAFSLLPVELNQMIARLLKNDGELCSFARSCLSAYNAIYGDNGSFWRKRFLSTFEPPGRTLDNAGFKKSYIRRRTILQRGARFYKGLTPREQESLRMLRDLIAESQGGIKSSNDNLRFILEFVDKHDLIRHVLGEGGRPISGQTCNPLLQIIYIMATPRLLSLSLDAPTFRTTRYPASQRAVYGFPGFWPIVQNEQVDLEWVLHHVNFWRHHLLRTEEGGGELKHAFENLREDEYPRFWSGKLGQGYKPAGKHWKGRYGFVSHADLAILYSHLNESHHVQEEFNGEEEVDAWQTMTLTEVQHDVPENFGHSTQAAQTPNGLPFLDQLRNFESSDIRFKAEGIDIDSDFLAQGWFHALPKQQGIPGWQRMSMMKYTLTLDGSNQPDMNDMWAYEGVVLPGGQIILGRWWSAAQGFGDQMYHGPFIFWCVD